MSALSASALLALCLALCLAVAPGTADAQVFFGSRPTPGLTVGPLFVVAGMTPDLDAPVMVDVYFSLVVPPDRPGSAVEQDIHLLWPGAIAGDPAGRPDPTLTAFAETRHFSVIDEGRLKLMARNFYRFDGEREPEEIPGGAPYVTFVRQGGALGLTSPATLIRIPWTPKLVNRAWLMDLKFAMKGAVRPKQATWVEETFWGRRHLVSLSFHDLRSRAMFPVYFEHRDRVLRLAEDPSQITLNFGESARLKIDQVSPPSASRRPSESRESTEVVSLYLDRSEGLAPQVLTVQFGYFSGPQSWTPIIITFAFFVLGNLAGPLINAVVKKVSRTLSTRVQVGRPRGADIGRSSGVVLSRETLARIAPGETTYDQVLALCGPGTEEHESLGAPGRRTLVYRGRRVVPQRRRTYGWLATVSHWDVEHHEVEIEIDGDRVRDVQARVRRTRLDTT